MRLAFMGSAALAVPALRRLVAVGHAVAGVYSQPPRAAGRGQREKRTPLHDAAVALDLPVVTPSSLKDTAEQARFAALELDAAVVAAYGLLLPQPVLDAPRLGCLNIHASLLPRWRGAAPIERAILAGDTESGVTIMQMDAGLDTGPILTQRAVPIADTTTAAELHDRLAVLGAEMIVAALAGCDGGELRPVPQPAEGATYAKKLGRDDGRLDWSESATSLQRRVRAMTPWPGAWCELDGTRLKILAAMVVPKQQETEPGTVMDGALTIVCGEDALRLLRVQRPGRAPMETSAFLRGYPIAAGRRLG